MTKQTVIDLFREMDKKTGNAEIFLSHQELSLIKDHAIFAGRDINYICMGKNHFPDSTAIPDITGIIPRVGSVPIMALMLALNMGFKEIYILGADHDWFAKNEYKYSFEPTVMKGKDFGVNDNGTLTEGILEQLPMAVKLWSQYRAIKNIAKNCGANIYSANPQTLLDEFPKISLEEAVGSKIG